MWKKILVLTAGNFGILTAESEKTEEASGIMFNCPPAVCPQRDLLLWPLAPENQTHNKHGDKSVLFFHLWQSICTQVKVAHVYSMDFKSQSVLNIILKDNTNTNSKHLFILLCVCVVCVCMCELMCTMHAECLWRGWHWITWTWRYRRLWTSWCGAEEQTMDLCKSSKDS